MVTTQGNPPKEKKAIRKQTIERRQKIWEEEVEESWTKQLIPDVRKWYCREFGEINYYITQMLTGHGCFQDYLCRIRKINTDTCPYCEKVDTAAYTIVQCERWEEARRTAQTNLGSKITTSTILDIMLQN
ncbi:hypothetical protein K1T71_006260 [Dendrolimus kikuchii]|uniref:Uncharacterized protein n=1 Tax=Dendrolimus kikuchii TaxID=765133 RepID=A0ACC1D4I9_9NEOP|nr:hypothetical protein K1T71_006260 [Dendrolimus kikuchii]